MSEQVLPFYLVCDESGSMAGAPIQAINDSLPALHHEVSTNPVVADKTRFSLVGFSDTAEVILSLADLSDVAAMPGLAAKSSTNYGAAFSLLKSQIQADVDMLKADGHKVLRPVVFFLSDGQPTDSWESEYKALVDTGNPYHPHIVAFGIGDADDSVIAKVATFKAFKADGTLGPAEALKEFASSLTKSIVKSGSSVSPDGQMNLQVPDQVQGFTSLPVNQI
jgi:uncharacterized protein YegL